MLCPSTCEAVNAQAEASAVVEFGCEVVIKTRQQLSRFNRIRGWRYTRRMSNRPWEAERKWNTFVMESSARSTVAWLWGCAVLFSAILAPTSFQKWRSLFAVAVLGVFWLFAIVLVVSAIKATARLFKYGSPRLLIAQIPFATGGDLEARVVVKRVVRVEWNAKATLTCRHFRGAGKYRKTLQPYSSSVRIESTECSLTEREAVIPLKMQIPAGLPARRKDTGDAILWTLEVRAETPGVDFAAMFEDLPVYEVSDPSEVQRNPSW